jgi:hypothetical protein
MSAALLNCSCVECFVVLAGEPDVFRLRCVATGCPNQAICHLYKEFQLMSRFESRGVVVAVGKCYTQEHRKWNSCTGIRLMLLDARPQTFAVPVSHLRYLKITKHTTTCVCVCVLKLVSDDCHSKRRTQLQAKENIWQYGGLNKSINEKIT